MAREGAVTTWEGRLFQLLVALTEKKWRRGRVLALEVLSLNSCPHISEEGRTKKNPNISETFKTWKM